MKKIISLCLIVMVVFASFGASAAAVPEFMQKTYNNYTTDYKILMSIKNADEIVAFFEELNMPEQINNFVDVKALLESLLALNSTMNLQAEISEDFRKINVALTAESNQNIVYNRNYESSYHTKMGIWVKADMDKKELVLVYATPLNEKYAVIDIAKDAPAEVSDAIFEMYDKLFNREIVDKYTKEITEIAMKHADISIKGKTGTIHYDNDDFTAAIDDIMEYMKSFYEELDISINGEPFVSSEFPSFEGIRLLGEEGLTYKYQFVGDNIKTVSENGDISIGIADIYTRFTGKAWNYNFSGNINISLNTDAEVSKIGSTVVSMPVLTPENSFSLVEFFTDMYDYSDYESEPYISSWIWGETETEVFDGERYYMPLRACIEDVYYEYSSITYDNGLVTITTNTGIDGRDINASLKVGEDTAIVNGVTYDGLGTFRLVDGSVYASVDFYEKCLGWDLCSLQRDLLEGYLSYEFYTSEYDIYFE